MFTRLFRPAKKVHSSISMESSHASAANLPGPSNMDMWNMLVAVQQQLKDKDAQLKDMTRLMTDMTADKDAQLKELHSLLNSKNEKLNDITSRAQQVEHDLTWVTDELLTIKGKRNLRGALECATYSIKRNPKADFEGVSTLLRKLLEDKWFQKVLGMQCRRFNVSYEEGKKCLGTIYGTLSQDMHGSTDTTVLLRYKRVAPVQRAVLHAVFDCKGIDYEARDEDDTVVEKTKYY